LVLAVDGAWVMLEMLWGGALVFGRVSGSWEAGTWGFKKGIYWGDWYELKEMQHLKL